VSGDELPTGWSTVSFEEALIPVSDNGKQIAQSDYLDSGEIPVVDQGEVLIGGYTADIEAVVDSPLPILVFGDHTRRTKYIDFPFAVGAQGVKLLRPTDAFSPKFLLYLIPTLDLPDRGYSRHYQFLRKLQFVMPPRPEQDRIVEQIEALVSEVDAAVAALKRVQTNLKRYRASVLKAACEGRLVPTEAELACKEGRSYESGEQLLQRIIKERRAKWEADQLAKMHASGKPPKDNDWKQKYKDPAPLDTAKMPELPEGWTWATVEQVSSAVQYGSSAKCSEAGDVPVLRMGNLTADGQLLTDNLKFLPANHPEFPELLLNSGDILFNRTNSAELVGKSAVYRGVPDSCSFASYLIRATLVTGCHAEYLAACLNSAHGRAWIKAVVNQQVGQANVNGTKLQAFVFPLPPSKEQERIVDSIESAFSSSSVADCSTSANLKRANRLRQSILKRAFEGKLVTQDLNDEPASVLLERIRAERTAASNERKPIQYSKQRRAKAGAGGSK
jgi:type I restriction enzyme S subunit